MSDKIDSRGVSMTVRPMTPHEMRRWPDAEIAFTIHYAEGGVKAHALTKIEDAEEFADTIKRVCKDARSSKDPRDLTACMDETLLAFHRLRENPGQVRAIRDTKLVYGIDSSTFVKGTVVMAHGLIFREGKYLLAVPSKAGFFDYKDFEIVGGRAE